MQEQCAPTGVVVVGSMPKLSVEHPQRAPRLWKRAQDRLRDHHPPVPAKFMNVVHRASSNWIISLLLIRTDSITHFAVEFQINPTRIHKLIEIFLLLQWVGKKTWGGNICNSASSTSHPLPNKNTVSIPLQKGTLQVAYNNATVSTAIYMLVGWFVLLLSKHILISICQVLC